MVGLNLARLLVQKTPLSLKNSMSRRPMRGWRGNVPNVAKDFLIAALHTSNWDFVVMLGMVFGLKPQLY